ncbi:MAG: low molecular weight protein arginine phosphatase [Gemmatimonadota bacterium]
MTEPRPFEILVVCTGNTCRSPLAAAALGRAIEQANLGNVRVSSAGTGAWEGAPASEGSYLVALEAGLDLSAHRARPLTEELVDGADLILAMSRSHLARARELGGRDRAHLFAEFAGAGEGVEVADPFGSDLEEYRRTLRELEEMTPGIMARLPKTV